MDTPLNDCRCERKDVSSGCAGGSASSVDSVCCHHSLKIVYS